MVKGDIYLANIYFSDSSESKIRPILLLKENSYSDFLFLPLTTNLDVPGFKLDNTHLAEGLLPKTSIVVCERIGVIAKNLLTRKIAKLDITTQQQIITELINFITEQAGFSERVEIARLGNNTFHYLALSKIILIFVLGMVIELLKFAMLNRIVLKKLRRLFDVIGQNEFSLCFDEFPSISPSIFFIGFCKKAGLNAVGSDFEIPSLYFPSTLEGGQH